jgi:hypothetical protein
MSFFAEGPSRERLASDSDYRRLDQIDLKNVRTWFHKSVTSHQKTKKPIATSTPRTISSIISHPQHQANLRPPKCFEHIHVIGDFAKPLSDMVNWVNSSQLLPPTPMECQP